MTELDIRMVVEEIEAWRKGERGSKLTWTKLERIFPFTRQTMFSKKVIREAYCINQMSSKKSVRKTLNSEQSINIEVVRLKKRLKELEHQIEEWQKLWLTLNL